MTYQPSKTHLENLLKCKFVHVRERTLLWIKQEGRCYWCDCRTQLKTRRVKPGEQPPKDLATLDHLIDKLNPHRQLPEAEDIKNKVMACWECNNERGNAIARAVPIDEWRARSSNPSAKRQPRVPANCPPGPPSTWPRLPPIEQPREAAE